ncbi:hypothetical protein GCM10009630_21590 [Kribbella jejuensis]|uniref:Uncharacterized protein DUF4440 n=1 Tax=Kribbella jejuensis TaxID=236068 RepID=A0A542DSU1_9ACTN|nr:nuclear transport factor 2 family protein [Kribbella jejuensis]TQJ06172.1 uncharacterized protein DUF4440 [Kribbella jejuensis]
MSKAEIDRLTAEFFGAFDNRDGKVADVDRIRRVMLPEGVIVCTAPQYAVYSVENFIEPRRALLSDGRLTEFSEWEVSERTQVDGDLAVRFSEYAKSGVREGRPFEGTGAKTLQFVRSPEGWRISAVAWYDHP